MFVCLEEAFPEISRDDVVVEFIQAQKREKSEEAIGLLCLPSVVNECRGPVVRNTKMINSEALVPSIHSRESLKLSMC